MPNYPYKEINTQINREFVAGLNMNFDEVEQDIREVMEPLQSVLDGKFDDAALAANFEAMAKARLEEIEPEYYEFQRSTKEQLAQAAQKSALAIERARIDQLATLAEGSTTGDAELIDGRIGADGVVYESLGNAVRGQIGFLSSSLKDLGLYGKNLILNANFNTTDHWDAVSPSNGTLAAVNNELEYNVVSPVASSRIQQFDYIPVLGHKYYVRGDINPKYNRTSYIAFGGVNVSKNPIANVWNKIQGIITPVNTTPFKFYHPTDAPYVSGGTFKFRRFLVIDLTETFGAGNEPELSVLEYYLSKFNDNWFEEGAFLTPSESLVNSIKIELEKEAIRVVDTAGNGDYTQLSLALAEASLNASKENPYQIQLNEGTFDMLVDYTKAQIDSTSFKGYTISDYVSLVGTGKKENTVIKAEIPSDWSTDTIMRVAPIANMGNGDLLNVTVIGKNCRYTVHDDYAYVNAKKLIKNCTFLKKAGLGNSQAWGEGTGSGMEFTFEEVEFITEYSQASYSTHNNTSHLKSTKHIFKNCSFKNAGGYYGIRFITLNSGQTEEVTMENCYVDGIIKFEEFEPGVGCRYNFKKVASTEVPILIDATDGSQPVYEVVEETKRMKSIETVTITKGTPVKLNNDGSVIQPFGSSHIGLIFGIALEDIAPNETGVLKTGGYLPVSDTNLTLVTGDLVGITNGSLAKVTTGDYIGVVTRSGFIKLKF